MSNVVILCTCFSSIFSNELITSVVFFQSLSFNFSRNQMLILCNTVLQILPISFFAEFNNLVVGWFTKLSLWSFKVKKQVLVPNNFYSIKHISSFCVLCTLFVYNILDSFRCFLISYSYSINENICPLNRNCFLQDILYIVTMKLYKKNYHLRTSRN